MTTYEVFKPANAGAQRLEVAISNVQVMRLDPVSQIVKPLLALAEMLLAGMEVEP